MFTLTFFSCQHHIPWHYLHYFIAQKKNQRAIIYAFDMHTGYIVLHILHILYVLDRGAFFNEIYHSTHNRRIALKLNIF